MRHSRRWMRAGIVAGAAVAACKFTPGTPASGPGDGKLPDHSLDAPPECTTSYVSCLDADRLVTCVAGGSSMTSDCGWGCVGSAGSASAHCAVLSPSGGAVG